MRFVLISLLIFFSIAGFSQSQLNQLLTPSDTLNKDRLKKVVITEVIGITSGLVALNELWYKEYPRTDFHFYNDNAEWLQMDKVGHFYTSYHIGRVGAEVLNWTGLDKKKQLLYGGTLGFVFLTAVETFDGYSSKWGFSWGDAIANVSGSALYISQEILWDEQRIIPKFSFHTTPYASRRPDALGKSYSEQILKDYNGQTYWLSVNLESFLKTDYLPKWLNLAFGYGATGMITGQDERVNMIFLPDQERIREYYLSLDIDLTKIDTNSRLLKTIFSVVNTIKIPAPTFEINSKGKTGIHLFYF